MVRVTTRFCVLVVALVWVATAAGAERLVEVEDFGGNPGRLRMHVYMPKDRPQPSALVIGLHGCGMSAREYAASAGWFELANAHGFVLLLPETNEQNNKDRCFRWYEEAHARRSSGEAKSVVEMIDRIHQSVEIDPLRVFVTGFSAGGAMTAVMLATYPDRFAGGSIVAGIPFGCATDIRMVFGCGTGLGLHKPAAEWGELVTKATRNYPGAWPRVQIWHGSHDPLVNVLNGRASIEQWTAVHGTDADPELEEKLNGHQHWQYQDGAGKVVVEAYLMEKMAHFVPIDPGTGPGQCGAESKYTAAVGLCSSYQALRFWGLASK